MAAYNQEQTIALSCLQFIASPQKLGEAHWNTLTRAFGGCPPAPEAVLEALAALESVPPANGCFAQVVHTHEHALTFCRALAKYQVLVARLGSGGEHLPAFLAGDLAEERSSVLFCLQILTTVKTLGKAHWATLLNPGDATADAVLEALAALQTAQPRWWLRWVKQKEFEEGREYLEITSKYHALSRELRSGMTADPRLLSLS
jgi:hypothetical protein